jgi:hypothetical protein
MRNKEIFLIKIVLSSGYNRGQILVFRKIEPCNRSSNSFDVPALKNVADVLNVMT